MKDSSNEILNGVSYEYLRNRQEVTVEIVSPTLTDIRGENGTVGQVIHAPSYPDWNQLTTSLKNLEHCNKIYKEFIIVGGHGQGDVDQIGLKLEGSVDGVVVRDGTIYQCSVGISGVHTRGVLRESVFDRVHIRKCHEGIKLEQLAHLSGDGINNITFRDCEVIYPTLSAVSLISNVSDEYVRRINFNGGLYHSTRKGITVAAPLIQVIGNCRLVRFRDIDVTGGDQTPTILIQGNGRKCPKDVSISGNIYQGEIWCCKTSYKTLDLSGLTWSFGGPQIKIIDDFVAST